MFTIILYGFRMICMELTRTDVVFSRTTVVLFFVQKWKFSKHRETFCGFFMDQKRTIGPEQHLGGAPREAQHTRARLGPQACPGGLCPLVLFWPSHKASGVSFVPKTNRQKVSSNSKNFYFCTKNNTTVVLLKTASVRVSSMQIIPKPYKSVVNMARILHKL